MNKITYMNNGNDLNNTIKECTVKPNTINICLEALPNFVQSEANITYLIAADTSTLQNVTLQPTNSSNIVQSEQPQSITILKPNTSNSMAIVGNTIGIITTDNPASTLTNISSQPTDFSHLFEANSSNITASNATKVSFF